MLIAIGLALVSLLLFSWIRSTRRARAAWLQSLNLPGVWNLQNSDQSESFEFSGDAERGRYTLNQDGHVTKGEWRIQGSALVLAPEGDASGTQVLSLHRIRGGNIGMDGPGRSRQIFRKQPTNIIPLRRKR